MPVLPALPERLALIRCLALLLAGFIAACMPAVARADDEPDLVPELRVEPDAGQVAPVYVDAFEEPGRLLYRFDAVLRNRGGTLDLYRDAGTGHAMQAVWAGGAPSETPDPNQPPSSPDATLTDLSTRGASFAYVFEKTHDHWHFFSAARYELELPDGTRRVSEKVGFCLFDGFDDAGGATLYFPPNETGGGPQTWCGFDHPDGEFVRMGLSPGAADRYASQREFQWIDIAGLPPRMYTLRAIANPDGAILEADSLNNVLLEARVIPGVVANEPSIARSGTGPVAIDLLGQVVAPEIPARRAADCEPVAYSEHCYVRAEPNGPLKFRIVRAPRHGTVEISAENGPRATATYVPADGYRGGDDFEYTATDARGLESLPATVQVPEPSIPEAGGKAARLVKGLALRRRGGRWFVIARLDSSSRVGGRLDRLVQRSASARPYRLVRRLRPRRLARGRERIALGRLAPGRYRVRLRFRGTDGRDATATRRFRVPRPR